MMIKDKSIKRILWWLVAIVLLSMIAVSTKAQHNKTFISVTLDSLTQRQDTLWITDDAGSVCYIRTSGDSLFLGDDTGEKAIGNLATGGTPGGSPTYSQYNDAGSFGGDADVKHYTDSLVVSKLLKVDEISVGGGAAVDTIYDYADIALDTSGVPLDNQLMYYVEPHKIAGSSGLTWNDTTLTVISAISGSIFIGENAGNSVTGGDNTIIGTDAGSGTTNQAENTLIGADAGRNINSANNTFVGSRAGQGISGGLGNNTLLGYSAGYSAGVTVTDNVLLGAYAGLDITGNENVIIGREAGYNATSGNVMIGHEVGYNETGSNLLYIDNSNTSSPLIWGDFSEDSLRFNSVVVHTDSTYLEYAIDDEGDEQWLGLSRTGAIFADSLIDAGKGLTDELIDFDEWLKDTEGGEVAWIAPAGEKEYTMKGRLSKALYKQQYMIEMLMRNNVELQKRIEALEAEKEVQPKKFVRTKRK